MFIERDLNHKKKVGTIEVVAGSMFSGKTEELIRRLKRAKIAKQKVDIYKPAIDVRYSEDEVVSHDENSIRSTPVENSANILLLSGDADVIGIDEAQFFDKGLIEVVVKLANMGIRVIVAGLDMDFKGVPFGPIPGLMAVADDVTKVHAICVRCGCIAQFSHRLSEKEQVVLLGEKDIYEPLCRGCYPGANKKND
ncbi:MAG: thymidine kinase [Prolixibacteraceae bacterium]|jgi:thymidine kinase|nr:thymidine kinase [Prolixibacteraceae bacterium]MBT6007192.1 thymidine kinase [Prolixibacteraceae bacterium]MBT6765803.1 thymidine kinase [Prolixibacteraceae bacterium]MBT6999698.1 thymidine kinase [Prolixibacteraceae bacterium]MBT7394083.1 thymidine kinase [Prolixibacteraceae bacterium]